MASIEWVKKKFCPNCKGGHSVVEMRYLGTSSPHYQCPKCCMIFET